MSLAELRALAASRGDLAGRTFELAGGGTARVACQDAGGIHVEILHGVRPGGDRRATYAPDGPANRAERRAAARRRRR